jgi:hypothetical protein
MVMVEQEPPTIREAGRIKDARGRKVTQLDPVMMHLLRRHDVIPSDALREIAKQVGIGMTQVNRALFWASLVGVTSVFITVPISITGFVRGWIDSFSLILSLLLPNSIWICVFIFWVRTRNVRQQRIGTVMLKHLRCPHCGYDLRSLPTDPADGLTVCPECGCAWRLDSAEGTQAGNCDDRK